MSNEDQNIHSDEAQAQPTHPPRSTNAKSPKKKRQSGQLSGIQVMFAAILAVGMVLGISLSTRIASSQPLHEGLGVIETEIAGLEQEYVSLLAERDYALSEAYVEQWARSDGKMVRQGEILVIPVPLGIQEQTENEQPLNFVESETVEPEPEIWERWWSLFFDSSPPEF